MCVCSIVFQFPHLIYGAVASSAPVQAKLDFSTFNKVNWPAQVHQSSVN